MAKNTSPKFGDIHPDADLPRVGDTIHPSNGRPSGVITAVGRFGKSVTVADGRTIAVLPGVNRIERTADFTVTDAPADAHCMWCACAARPKRTVAAKRLTFVPTGDTTDLCAPHATGRALSDRMDDMRAAIVD